jgi:hypothetical protein
VRIRREGTEAEITAAAARLATVLTVEEASDFYPNRGRGAKYLPPVTAGGPVTGRGYLTVTAPRPGRRCGPRPSGPTSRAGCRRRVGRRPGDAATAARLDRQARGAGVGEPVRERVRRGRLSSWQTVAAVGGARRSGPEYRRAGPFVDQRVTEPECRRGLSARRAQAAVHRSHVRFGELRACKRRSPAIADARAYAHERKRSASHYSVTGRPKKPNLRYVALVRICITDRSLCRIQPAERKYPRPASYRFCRSRRGKCGSCVTCGVGRPVDPRRNPVPIVGDRWRHAAWRCAHCVATCL